VIDRLKEFVSRKTYQLLRKKGVSCPDCGQSVPLPRVMPLGRLKAQMACGRCDWRGSLIDVMSNGSQPVSPLEVKPVGSRIRSSDYRWVIPGTGKVNGELFFGTIWLLFCVVFIGVTLLAGEGPGWQGVLIFGAFMIPFSAVGLWLFYVGAWKCWGELSVRINGDDFKMTRRLFGRVKEKRIPARQLEEIRLDVDSKNESGTTLELMIVNKEGKDLKLDPEISREEKRWLLGQWQTAVGMEPEEIEQNSVGGASARAAIDDGVVKLEPMKDECFRLTVRGRFGLWMLIAGVLHVVVGLVFCLSSGLFDGSGDAPGFFRVIDGVFAGFGFVMGLVATLGGVVLLVGGYLKLGEVKKYAFEEGRIKFTTVKRGGRISKQSSWPRAEAREVVKSQVGHSNGDPRYQVQLRGPENVNLIRFSSLEVADGLEAWVRNWIRGGAAPLPRS
jgi:hypothetical protein